MTSLRTVIRKLVRNQRGVAAVEMAFAFPIMMIMIWMVVQGGLVFRAVSGMQHALGEGARFATLFPRPTDIDIKQRISDKVYGIGPGTFTVDDPATGAESGTKINYLDLKVSYTQATSLLFLPGPTVTLSRTKRVWIAD
ncbi:MAG: TadE/TadG family type IV pilus assembly protein [Sphingomicrobium sp.]